ncbi:trans-aconitate 2-methyltransferase [Rubellimicrobium sp. CFH 75288]|uniref:class I SAM-dependent methyltransferase n=1 Tax=Rubellimicrobium sp. CFH 75288 TaxID=2697034 RepID=UPI0014137853|nr:class I SAM-dependent methyltransferase [Rubellimicrobium sp. CFH 75288]NAZ35331.1 methyltransferase domain-containing protein [Rubellimicrobium sp. CFH 75288]
MDPDDVIAAYDRNGRVWAASRDRRLTERPWLDRALALAPREAGKRRVLDLGCGAGRPLAEYLVDRGCLVTGVDASRPMIELFARVVPAATALHADMRGLRLNAVFDLILVWDSLFHLTPDHQRGMVPVLTAHAAPRAVLLMTTGPCEGTATGRIGDSDVYHASLDPDEYRTLLEEAGWEILGFWPEEEACGGRSIWMARRRG